MLLRKVFLSTVSALVALNAGQQMAMAADRPASDNANALEEIVVTARKREESILDTPIAITAITGDVLAEKGITSFNQLAESTPSINIGNISAGRSDRSFQQITLRGFVPSSTLSTLTATFIDGAPVASSTAVMSVFDPARVEILKGPQAAYFGRNTFAGAVNVVNKEPGQEFSGNVSLMAGQRNNLDIQGSISGPIAGDRVGFRLAARMFKKDGSYANGAVPGETLGDQETRTFNVFLTARPIENLKIKAFALYSKDDDGPSAQGQLAAWEIRSNNGAVNIPRLSGSSAGTVLVPSLSNCTVVGWFRGTTDSTDRFGDAGLTGTRPWICGAAPSLPLGYSPVQNTTETALLTASLADPRQRIVSPSDGVKGYGLVREYWHGHLNVDWEIGDSGFTLSSLTGINDEYYSEVEDLDNYNTLSLTNPSNPTGALTTRRNFWDFLFGVERDTKDFSQELRLAYDKEGPFTGLIGVNYLDTLVWADLISITAEIVTGSDRLANAGSNAGKNFVETRSVFFGGTYKFSDAFKLSLEGRYQQDHVFGFAPMSRNLPIIVGSAAATQFGVPAGSYPALSPLIDKKYTNFLPRAIVQWNITPDMMAYASYSKGINVGVNTFNTAFLGGSSLAISTAQGLGISVVQQPEKLTNYEIGYKASFLGDRMRLQSAFYWGTWTDQLNNRGTFFQDLPIAQGGTGTIAQVSGFVNSGEAKIKGVEVELTARPTQHLDLNFAAAMNDTDIQRYVSPSVTQLSGVSGAGYVGHQLPAASKYSMNFGVKYGTPISAWEDGKWFVRGDLSWKDKLYLDAANITWIKARSVVNLRAGVSKGPLSFEAFALNAFNDKNYVSIAANNILSPGTNATNSVGVATNNALGYLNVGLPELRTIGARITYDF
jgi:iron complex outermembrane receptor protein